MTASRAARLVWMFVVMLVSMLGSMLVTPSRVEAQELRGTVVHADGSTPANGVIVLLLHATRDSVLARSVTGARGAFLVRAPVATTVRVELRRVGHRPMGVGTYTLAAGESRTVDVSLVDMPIMLAAFDVRASSRCDVRPDTAGLVSQLYEEARKSLILSATQGAGSQSTASYSRYTRFETVRGRAVGTTQRTTVRGPTTRPFVSRSADSLARFGYVKEEADGTVYYAPDAETLLSDSFSSAHCFTVVDGTGENKAYMGLGFRPVANRRGVVDIRGTMWFDRASSTLEFLEFQYDGIPSEHQRGGVGGRVEFAQTSDGGWLVSRWAIRMPRVTMRPSEGNMRSGLRGGFNPLEVVVDTIVVTGGEVQSVTIDGAVVYASAPTLNADEVTASSAPVAAISGSLSTTATRGFDTLRVESTCEAPRDGNFGGVVSGRVVNANGSGIAGASVTAEWKQDFRHVGGHEWRWEYRQLTATTVPTGHYVICGAPLERVVTVWATEPAKGDSASSGERARRARSVVVRMNARSARAVADLSIGAPKVVASGRSSMLRVIDLNGQPVAHALVSVDGAIGRVADDEGRVIMPVVSRDSVRVYVRRIGYQPFDGTVVRQADGDPFAVRLFPAAQALATVTVRARGERTALELSGFYDRVADVQRGATVGEFFTPEDLEKRAVTQLSQLLNASRYAKVQYMAKDRGERSMPVLTGRGGCPMTVWVDGIRTTDLYSGYGSKAGAVQLDELVGVANIAGIEIYPSAFGAPAKFIPPPTVPFCGVLVVWTENGVRK